MPLIMDLTQELFIIFMPLSPTRLKKILKFSASRMFILNKLQNRNLIKPRLWLINQQLMENEVSRRDFLKVLSAGALVLGVGKYAFANGESEDYINDFLRFNLEHS